MYTRQDGDDLKGDLFKVESPASLFAIVRMRELKQLHRVFIPQQQETVKIKTYSGDNEAMITGLKRIYGVGPF